MPRASGCTMGPPGSVDFADLVRRFSEDGYFVDPDFPANDEAIFPGGIRSGFEGLCSNNLPRKVSAGCLVCWTRATILPAPPSGSVRRGNL